MSKKKEEEKPIELGQEVWLFTGRLDGWDNDMACLVAGHRDQALKFFVDQKLFADNSYERGDREHYVSDEELIGWIQPDGKMRLAHNAVEGLES